MSGRQKRRNPDDRDRSKGQEKKKRVRDNGRVGKQKGKKLRGIHIPDPEDVLNDYIRLVELLREAKEILSRRLHFMYGVPHEEPPKWLTE